MLKIQLFTYLWTSRIAHMGWWFSSHYQIACHVHYSFIWLWCTLNLNSPFYLIKIFDAR
jgi:hypothetical protein